MQLLMCSLTYLQFQRVPPDNYMPLIERFIVLLYSRTSTALNVNGARQELFSKKSRAIEHSANSSCPNAAHKACCLSGWTCVGKCFDHYTTDSKSTRIGLEKRRKIMETSVDSSVTSMRIIL